MSFLTELHTFGAWAEKELAKLVGIEPKIEQIAGTVLTYAGPALQTIVTAEAGAPAGALVGKVISAAQADLTAASGLIYDFGASPSVASVISSVQTNLSGLLTAGHITDAKSVGTATKIVTELGQLANAIAPAPPAPAA